MIPAALVVLLALPPRSIAAAVNPFLGAAEREPDPAGQPVTRASEELARAWSGGDLVLAEELDPAELELEAGNERDEPVGRFVGSQPVRQVRLDRRGEEPTRLRIDDLEEPEADPKYGWVLPRIG